MNKLGDLFELSSKVDEYLNTVTENTIYFYIYVKDLQIKYTATLHATHRRLSPCIWNRNVGMVAADGTM